MHLAMKERQIAWEYLAIHDCQIAIAHLTMKVRQIAIDFWSKKEHQMTSDYLAMIVMFAHLAMKECQIASNVTCMWWNINRIFRKFKCPVYVIKHKQNILFLNNFVW